MRGLYTAAYLCCVSRGFSKRRNVGELDLGAGFDLIAGTSTGAIIACSLAAGLPPDRIVQLYRDHGKKIFPRKLPTGGFKLLIDILGARRRAVRSGNEALRVALTGCFGDITVGQLFTHRRIALAIPAVELGHHNSWVFKTPHLNTTNHRDDGFTLVDVCLATSAAPLFRSLAAISRTSPPSGKLVFADGGLWANNPVLVGLIDALEMTAPEQEIEIFCLGTCPLPAGENTAGIEIDRGLLEWKFGGEAAKLAIDAQEFAYDNMARMLSRHVRRKCRVIRFPRESVPAPLMEYLDLDDTRDEAAEALIGQANLDANMTNSRCSDPNDNEGKIVNQLFMDIPERDPESSLLTEAGLAEHPPLNSEERKAGNCNDR